MLETPTPSTVRERAGDTATAAVRIVVVHFRCLPATSTLLRLLRERAPGTKTVVVANGSGDGSDERLRTTHAGDDAVEVIVAPRNGGFGAGCNLGIARAIADPACRHVLLLNPDLEPEPGFLDAMLDLAARRPDAAVVGARVLSLGGPLDRAHVFYENGRIPRITLSRCQVPAPRGLVEFATEFVTGACMLLEADVLRAGLRFDERYFLYVEDLDLCRQVSARGRSLWVTTRAVVRHADGGTQRDDATLPGGMRAQQLYELARGKMLFAKKWFGPAERALALLFALVVKPIAALVAWRSMAPVRAHLRGALDGLRAARTVTREAR